MRTFALGASLRAPLDSGQHSAALAKLLCSRSLGRSLTVPTLCASLACARCCEHGVPLWQAKFKVVGSIQEESVRQALVDAGVDASFLASQVAR